MTDESASTPIESSSTEVLGAPEVPEVPDASSSFLSDLTGNNVIVKLNSGLQYQGKLQSVDGFMNIALEQTKELVDMKVTKVYGDVFVRGNNGKLRKGGKSFLFLTSFVYFECLKDHSVYRFYV